MPNLESYNDHWKIDLTIQHCLKNGVKSFIITPLGELGLQAKNILENMYNISNIVCVDDQKTLLTKTLSSLNDISSCKFFKNTAILIMAKKPISEQLYNRLSLKFSKEQILCPFDDFNTKPNKFSSPPDEYPSLKITFSGDLILLEDMVKCACLQDSYDFSNIFEYIHNVYKESDLNIGVLEGPVCPNQNYSISNIYDGKDIKLNFPPEFITSIKQAGINLVTTCNNHSFDCGVEGLLSTIDCLTCENLNHVGTYRNVEEKTKPFVITIKGVRIGILAYTYGFNKCAKYEFVNKYSQHSRLLPDLSDAIGINPCFKKCFGFSYCFAPYGDFTHTLCIRDGEKMVRDFYICRRGSLFSEPFPYYKTNSCTRWQINNIFSRAFI